jgi:hypothetical protein
MQNNVPYFPADMNFIRDTQAALAKAKDASEVDVVGRGGRGLTVCP